MNKNRMLQLISVVLLMLLILGCLCACGKVPESPSNTPAGEQTTAGTETGIFTNEQPSDSGQPENPDQPNPDQPDQPETNPWGISDGNIQTTNSKIYHN